MLGLRHVTPLEADYPSRLRGLSDAPASITLQGGRVEATCAVAIVGARAAIEESAKFARELAAKVARAGRSLSLAEPSGSMPQPMKVRCRPAEGHGPSLAQATSTARRPSTPTSSSASHVVRARCFGPSRRATTIGQDSFVGTAS